MKIYKKAILPAGFTAGGLAAGIKKRGKLDLALFYSEVTAKAACVFTENKIQAAPIKINKAYLKKNRKYRAIIVNSGNANCFTGPSGIKDARGMGLALAGCAGIKKESVLVASTGIIGKKLPLAKIKSATPALFKSLSAGGINKAKKAILTTDRFTKEMTVKFDIAARTVTVCGIAKGAGMIAPNMATMLAFIFTDASITQQALDKSLKLAVDESFNCISVDGCMSTNDSLMVLANGAAVNRGIQINKNFNKFREALKTVCLELAKMIVKDAEGATKFIQIKVSGAKTFKEARSAALSIANSNLFKTAIYGENPNFGRIIAALGSSGIAIEEDRIKVKVSSLKKKKIQAEVSLNQGKASAVVYTSDLTPEYIRINAEYN